MRVKPLFQIINDSKFSDDFIAFLGRMEEQDPDWRPDHEWCIENFMFTISKLNLVDLSP